MARETTSLVAVSPVMPTIDVTLPGQGVPLPYRGPQSPTGPRTTPFAQVQYSPQDVRREITRREIIGETESEGPASMSFNEHAEAARIQAERSGESAQRSAEEQGLRSERLTAFNAGLGPVSR